MSFTPRQNLSDGFRALRQPRVLVTAIGMVAFTLTLTSQLNEPWATWFRGGGAFSAGSYIFGAGVRLRERERSADEE